jgi:hypothetical protein
MTMEVSFNFIKNIFLSLFCIVISCKEPKQSITDEITSISYDQAIVLYGKPMAEEVFDNANQDEVFLGIRARIAKYYKAGVKVTIKEAIWVKNDSIYTAIWYTKKQNNWLPFDSFEYNKGVDF